MEPSHIHPGMECTLADGSLVVIQQILPDNIHIRVKYIDAMDNPAIPAGSIGDVPYEELISEYLGDHAEGAT
jgi:hypothetical protein